ncbi:hypothetical protein F4819DRAFT_460911 [Hypoxylon fuscum]|nr:hypothetical protein F4819DRAFT_460911 [Hypoxylon fuscum]
MAIQSELERAQFSSPTNTKTENDHRYQQQWLQLVTSPDLRAAQWKEKEQYSRRELLVGAQSPVPNVAHEHRVQWWACQLSKENLRKYLNFIPTSPPLLTGCSRFETLPQDILGKICRYVPYEDLLRLYQLSKTLHVIINPHLAPYETIISFVLRAERDFRQHYRRNPPNSGCYMCYRVLPAEVFARDQVQQARIRTSPFEEQSVVNLRRFCICCGIQSGCHGRGDSLITQTGIQYWLCDCLHVLGEKTSGCGDCRMLCPIVSRGSEEASSSKKPKYSVFAKYNELRGLALFDPRQTTYSTISPYQSPYQM